LRVLDGAKYCEACAQRPEVGVADKFRAARLGRRDPWSWIVGGMGAVYGLFLSTRVMSAPDGNGWIVSLVWLALAGVHGAFFLGWGPARSLLPLALVFAGVALKALDLTGLSGFVIPLIVVLQARADVANQLFFRRPVADRKVRRFAERLQNNGLSHVSYALASAGFFLFPLLPVAWVLTFVSLARVDATAQPPVGRGFALRALWVGLAAPVLLLALFVGFYQVFQHGVANR
jgi:hypothetical protein